MTAIGDVYTMGHNNCGETGNNCHTKHSAYLLPNLECVQVSLGLVHTLLLSKDNQVYACGYNGYNQCSNTCKEIEIRVPQLWTKEELGVEENSVIVRVVAGSRCSFVVFQD